MIANLLLASVLHGGPAVRPFDPPAPNAPTVRLWLNDNGRYRPGDKAKVTVRSSSDGYLVVVNVDPDKQVRVLYPLNPGDDAFVRGGFAQALSLRSVCGRQPVELPRARRGARLG